MQIGPNCGNTTTERALPCSAVAVCRVARRCSPPLGHLVFGTRTEVRLNSGMAIQNDVVVSETVKTLLGGWLDTEGFNVKKEWVVMGSI